MENNDITLQVIDFGWDGEKPYVELSRPCESYTQQVLRSLTYETFAHELYTRPDEFKCYGRRVYGVTRQTGEGLEL